MGTHLNQCMGDANIPAIDCTAQLEQLRNFANYVDETRTQVGCVSVEVTRLDQASGEGGAGTRAAALRAVCEMFEHALVYVKNRHYRPAHAVLCFEVLTWRLNMNWEGYPFWEDVSVPKDTPIEARKVQNRQYLHAKWKKYT